MAIVFMVHKLNIQVVAEGVETASQYIQNAHDNGRRFPAGLLRVQIHAF